MTTSDRRPHLLVVATGAKPYREYLLRSIATRFRVHLFVSAEPTWENAYVDAVTVLTSTLDAEVVVTAAKGLDARDHLHGVLCWDEARILQTAAVAAALGLRGGDVAVIERCRDKHLSRQAFAAHDVPQPRSVLVGTVEEALAAADGIGYPVVLKPRALAASLGVVLVHDPAELQEQFAFARDTTVHEAVPYEVSVLVEQYADGPEISVDCVVKDGQVQLLCLAHKELGWAPYFEETGHVVSGDDPLVAAIMPVVAAAHRALSFTDGATHTELRLTPTGPMVVEVNGRLGGGLIPYLGLLARGVDPGLAAAAVACGLEPDVRPTTSRVAGVRFDYVTEPTTIAAIDFERTALPAEIAEAVVLLGPGTAVEPPPAGTAWGRIAFVIAVGDAPDAVRAALADPASRPKVVAADG